MSQYSLYLPVPHLTNAKRGQAKSDQERIIIYCGPGRRMVGSGREKETTSVENMNGKKPNPNQARKERNMQPETTDAAAVNIRDVKADMVAFMRDRPGGCTREDLLQEFMPKQIDKYAVAAAREANRQANRRLT